MKKILVLLNRPEDIDAHLPELKEIAVTHEITKIYLARLSRAFGSRVRSIVAPHKLAKAVQMSDAAASNHLLKIADDLRTESLDAELVKVGLPDLDIDKFVEKNEISIVVTSDGYSGLCRWPGAIPLGIQEPFFYEHVFGLEQAIPQRHPHGDNKSPRKQKSRGSRNRKDAK